jgi:probable phosphoglycerate mutase
MPTTFLLIRHASTDSIGHALTGRLPGIRLNEKGQWEAARLAERLANTAIEAIYSSPLERAMETAQAIAQRLQLPVQVHERLTEIDVGKWAGRRIESLVDDKLWARFNSLRSSTRPPRGELMLEVQTRIAAEMEELHERHPDRTIALVSHGDVIKGAVALYAGVPLDLFHRIEIWPASITVIRLADWGPQLVTINDAEVFKRA